MGLLTFSKICVLIAATNVYSCFPQCLDFSPTISPSYVLFHLSRLKSVDAFSMEFYLVLYIPLNVHILLRISYTTPTLV